MGPVASSPGIAITGLGLASPAGATIELFWSSLCQGVSFARPLTTIEVSDLPVRFGCPVPSVGREARVLGERATRRMDQVSLLALQAGLAAVHHAGAPAVDPARAAVVVGTGVGGMDTHERATLGEAGVDRLRWPRLALAVPTLMANAPAANLAIALGWRGPNLTISTACASGANAIGEGARLLREGSADVVLAGGADAPLTRFGILGFDHLRALSRRNDAPAEASRPFDRSRDGFVLAEGAGFVIMERAGDARARGARAWGRLLGYARNNDAFNLITPDKDGRSAGDCMRLALQDAGITADDVVHINAHGTSTVLNDQVEAKAIISVFGSAAPPVTSIKGSLGHALGAAGALDAIASVLCLCHGEIPPTVNHLQTGSEIQLDIVTGESRRLTSSGGGVLTNSFGLGGQNACLVLSA